MVCWTRNNILVAAKRFTFRPMAKKVFISHASADEKIVSLFVDFILHDGCGVDLEDIMYTSSDDTGIPNGEDIPSALKDGIRECRLFIMMVSPHYRKSEVCLNEMGAAWMCDGIKRMILLLPSVDFDRMGWLMSLHKATRLTDSRGLDQVHDHIMSLLSTNVQTVTWGRYKSYFSNQLKDLSADNLAEDNGESFLIDYANLDVTSLSEKIDMHTQAYVFILNEFSAAMTTYSGQLNEMSRKLNLYSTNPKSFTDSQFHSIFIVGARNTDTLSAVYEVQTTSFRYHFDQSIKCMSLIRNKMAGELFDENILPSFKGLKEKMIEAYTGLKQFRNTLDANWGKNLTFKKSIYRLKIAMDNMLSVVSFCISRISDLA